MRIASWLSRRLFDHVQLVPIEWLTASTPGHMLTLGPAVEGRSYGPMIGNRQQVEVIRLPPIELFSFTHAQVSTTSAAVVVDGRAVIEAVPSRTGSEIDARGGYLDTHGRHCALIATRPTGSVDEGLFLAGDGSYNYFHWMVEILPRLQHLQKLDELLGHSIPLLVSAGAISNANFRAALSLLVEDAGTRVVELDDDRTWNVGTLLYITAPNPTPFNLKGKKRMRVSDYLLRTSTVEYWRTRAAGYMHPTNDRPKIFVARGQQAVRRYNQDEVWSVFETRGFVRVLLEDLTLSEQISLFAQADAIAGPHGAGLTNLMFSHRGCKALSWVYDFGQASAFSNIAAAVGVDLRYVLYTTTAKSLREANVAEYTLDTGRLQEIVDDWLLPMTR